MASLCPDGDQSYLPNKITKKTNLLSYEPQNLFLRIVESSKWVSLQSLVAI